MAAIEESRNSNHKEYGGRRSKKRSTRIDLTPMVDLGFLLITFFLFTTTLAKPKVMALTLPYDGPSTPWREGQTMTLLLSKNHTVYYYEGPGDAPDQYPIRHTDFNPANGIRQVIMDKNKRVKDLQQAGIIPFGADACFLIKADTNSTYQDFVQIMDELNINDVKVKAVVDITPYDRALLARH